MAKETNKEEQLIKVQMSKIISELNKQKKEYLVGNVPDKLVVSSRLKYINPSKNFEVHTRGMITDIRGEWNDPEYRLETTIRNSEGKAITKDSQVWENAKQSQELIKNSFSQFFSGDSRSCGHL